MKKWVILGLALAALVVAQKENAGMDVAKLEPVELLRVRVESGNVVIETDLGQRGLGGSLDAAVLDLKETASGEVFLETTEYLLISDDARSYLPELAELLRPSCRVCLDGGVEDLTAAADFLAVHKPVATLRLYRQGGCPLQMIMIREGRMYLGESETIE